MFETNLVEIKGVVFSPTLRTDRHRILLTHFLSSGDPKTVNGHFH